MWHTRRETNCGRCTTSRVIVGKRLKVSRKGAGAGWWRKPCCPVGDLRGEGRCELDRARGYYSNWHFTSHTCTCSQGANQRAEVCSGGRVEGWHRCCWWVYQGCNCTADICLSVCHTTRCPIPQHTHTHTHVFTHSPLTLQVLLRAAFLWKPSGPLCFTHWI